MKERLIEAWVLLISDKKKAGLLAVLTLAAVGLGLRAMVTGGKPASASAATGAATSGSSDVSNVRKQTFEQPPLVVLPHTEPLTRDLFAPGPAFGVKPSQPEQSDDSGPKSAQGSDDKTPVSPELRRLELERAVREEASRLQLSSTMVGSNPIAVFQQKGSDGSRAVLRVGESIEGFELVSVSARNAVLIKNGIRVELSIGQR